MTLRKFIFIFILIGLFCSVYADKYKDYVDKYSAMAVDEMHRSGVPASITLAQGLLESGAGLSTLATHGNNHFGIKCHNTWQGDTMLRDDDAPDECFRVYESAAQSFADHSNFLHGRRYRPLFELDITDYRGWAEGLKKCGYATSPTYAAQLTAIIERYGLYRFDVGGEAAAELDAQFILQSLQSTHALNRMGERYYVIAYPGDTYEVIAAEFNADAERISRANGHKQITDWTEIYLNE